MGEHVHCTVHITINFDQEIPSDVDVDLSEKGLTELENGMQTDLQGMIRQHLISEDDDEVENLNILVHVDISKTEE